MKRILLIVFLTLLLSTIIVVGVLIFSPSKTPSDNSLNTFEEEKKEPVVLYAYDTGSSLITNMKDSKRFVKASIVLEVANEEEVSSLAELDYKIRDTIIRVLRDKTEEDYQKNNIQSLLKEEIKIELNNQLPDNEIEAVYFKELVIQ